MNQIGPVALSLCKTEFYELAAVYGEFTRNNFFLLVTRSRSTHTTHPVPFADNNETAALENDILLHWNFYKVETGYE